MYSDYEVAYRSNLNEHLGLVIAFSVFSVLALILTLFALSKIFKKANMSGVSAWIPFYNAYIVTEVANLPTLYFFLLIIPGVNIFAIYKVSMTLATLFKKKKNFGYGLFFFPYIYYPILAFGDSEYIGINLVAMYGKETVEEIPIIDENKNQEIEVEVNNNLDVASRNINISIGGGKYQKEYTDNLVGVDQSRLLDRKAAIEARDANNIFINNDLIKEEKVEKVKQEDATFSVPFINGNNESNNTVGTNEKVIVPNTTVVIPDPVINKPEENVNIINGMAVSSRSDAITPEKPKPNANGEYKTCPNCGTRVGEGAKVCFICGQPIE